MTEPQTVVPHQGQSGGSATPGAWRPLRNKYFRSLLIADFVSDVGSFFQAVGAAWLMTSLTTSPLYIALIQTASALPFFLLAIPAGTMGDIIDRRKLILGTETWMLLASVVLAVATMEGAMTPWLLLLITLALSAGDAVESPAWRATFPELVSKEDLPAALALNGVEFNLARAVGPGVAGIIVSVLGVGVAFVLNAFSFLGVIIVVFRWKRPVRANRWPAEGFVGGMTAAVRYVRYSPGIRTLLWRSGVLIFFASAFWALLPAAAKGLSGSSIAYGLLLGFFGVGAVMGAALLPRMRARFSMEITLGAATAAFAGVLLSTALLRSLAVLCVLMLFGGAAWTVFMSLFNIIAQKLAPDWVRARVLAYYLFVYQGSVAAGSTLWGFVALHLSVHRTLAFAGVGTAACIALQPLLKLPDTSVDLSAWNHWLRPAMFEQPDPDDGPVLVTVKYTIDPAKEQEFLRAIYEYEQIRRRDGATYWDVFADTESPNAYVETFLVDSWAEHERQHSRFTRSDQAVENRIDGYLQKATEVKHYIRAANPQEPS
jgi:MFS family permease